MTGVEHSPHQFHVFFRASKEQCPTTLVNHESSGSYCSVGMMIHDSWNDDYDDCSLMITLGLHLVSPNHPGRPSACCTLAREPWRSFRHRVGHLFTLHLGMGRINGPFFSIQNLPFLGESHGITINSLSKSIHSASKKGTDLPGFDLPYMSFPARTCQLLVIHIEVIFWTALATGRWDKYDGFAWKNWVLLLPWFIILFPIVWLQSQGHSHILRMFTKLSKRWHFQPCCERFFSRKALNLHTMKDPEEHNLEYCTTRNVQELYCWTE